MNQNQSCKEQITSDFLKSKSIVSKSSIKSISNVSIASGIGVVKRGSTVSLPPQGLTRSNRFVYKIIIFILK